MKKQLTALLIASMTMAYANAADTAKIVDNQTGDYAIYTDLPCQYSELASNGFEHDFRTSEGLHGCYTYKHNNDTLYMAAPNGRTVPRRMVDIKQKNTVISLQPDLTAQQMQAIFQTYPLQSTPRMPAFSCMTVGSITTCQ